LIDLSAMPENPKHSKPHLAEEERPKTPDSHTRPAQPISPPRKRVRPIHETHEYYKEYSIPVKAKVQGTVEFLEAQNIPYFKNDVFRHFGVSKSSGYEMLQEGHSARRQDTLHEHNPSHRPKAITFEKIKEMESILEKEGFEGKVLTWEQIAMEVGLDLSWRTVKRTLGTMDYHKCIACRKGWVNRATAEKRLEHAKIMLQQYPNPEDWHRIWFSDEVHFGFGPQGKLLIIRKPGLRYCQDCIQEADEPAEKDKKRFHCWAAVGWNFKSPIYFYEVPGNTNGKMSQQVYIDQILEPIVKPWLDTGHDFVLEEDGDSGYGPGKNNPVRTWKENHGLKHYFNCSNSPDLSPIENCWLPPKAHVRKFPHWDDSTTKELILEGWEQVSQEFINKQIDSMPERYRAVIEGAGKMTGY
jgi:hypothetical protein